MNNEYRAKLSIHESQWSGLATRPEEPVTQNKEPYAKVIYEREKIELNYANNKYIILVKEIGKNYVKLHIDGLVSKNREGNKVIHPEPFEITLSLNNAEVFSTPTLDAGINWKITLLSIERTKLEKPIISSKLKFKAAKHYFPETQNLISQLEEKLSTRIIVYYVPEKNYIDQEHPDYFLDQLRDMGYQEKISLILFSAGGDSCASFRIVSLLRGYCKQLEIIAPSLCGSAASMLALGADKILFTLLGYITPIDTQLGNFGETKITNFFPQISLLSFKRAMTLLEKTGPSIEGGIIKDAYRSLFEYVDPVVYVQADQISKRSKILAEAMMKTHPYSFPDDQKINSIADHLVYDYPDHNFPILYHEAKEIGLPVEMVDADTSNLLWNLLKYYRAITREMKTVINVGFTHTEETSLVIESVNKRIIKRYSYDKRFFSNTNRWEVTNDNSLWAKLTPTTSDTNSKPYDFTPIELGDIDNKELAMSANKEQNNSQSPTG